MIVSLCELTVYADSDGEIPPWRVENLIKSAKTLGGELAPIEYVEPIPGGDPRPWGLRIRIIDNPDD